MSKKKRGKASASGRRSVSATEAQNNFGRVLGQATTDGVVYITRYDRPTAVVMSIAEYDALARTAGADLDELTREFDARLASMQTPGAVAAVKALFEMGTEDLGAAAVEAARNEED